MLKAVRTILVTIGTGLLFICIISFYIVSIWSANETAALSDNLELIRIDSGWYAVRDKHTSLIRAPIHGPGTASVLRIARVPQSVALVGTLRQVTNPLWEGYFFVDESGNDAEFATYQELAEFVERRKLQMPKDADFHRAFDVLRRGKL